MSAAKPTAAKDTDPPKKQRVFPSDFAQFVAATAAGLGDGWAVDADSNPHSGLSAYLTHPDGRRIGIKHIWRGEGVQTWALDVPPREFERTGDAEAHASSVKHLTPGVRYNVGVCFTNNQPAATTARNIRTRLLPAFDGKRPPLRASSKKRPRRTAGAGEGTAVAGETTSSDTTRATDQAQPKKATAKTTAAKKAPRRAAKKAQPDRQAAEPKKQPAAPGPRRATTTAAKTAKAKEAKARRKSQPADSPTSN
ncbi:hypothetical protein [Streptomyces antimycoticus]|uniref:hypothetical protein n=1 Tax=Streptomyces antimycoticus TaxID=68175 RepID=UPI0038247EB7